MTTKIIWFGKEVSKATRKIVSRKVRQATFLVLADAIMHTPVDTGNLRNRNDVDFEEFKGVVYNPVEYALFVERGTEFQTAQPFLRPALFDNEDNIRRIFNDNKL